MRFHSRYGTHFINAGHILQSPEIIRVLNLHADLKRHASRRPERELCETTIEGWLLWIDDGQPAVGSPFDNTKTACDLAYATLSSCLFR